MAVDTTKWNILEGESLVSQNQAYNRPENVTTEDGILVITAKEEEYGGASYTSGELTSKVDFCYGRITARVKCAYGQGIWNSFWMLPTANIYGPWPQSGEIDIMEDIDFPPGNKILGTLHYGSVASPITSTVDYYLPVGNFQDDYHEFALEWNAKWICWSCDDIVYSAQRDWQTAGGDFPAPFDQRFYVILGLAIADDDHGPPDETTEFPQKMYVDWVRVYH